MATGEGEGAAAVQARGSGAYAASAALPNSGLADGAIIEPW